MPRLETYEQVIEFLFGRINYERATTDSYSTADFKLDRMRRLLERIGSPHERIPAVHVAGTKGKGSTCAMLASVLSTAGLRTGLYISPHITAFEERMTVDGVQPTPEQLVELVNRVRPIVEEMDALPGQMEPTYFELATALAWMTFDDARCDVVVLEVGLGGRLDCTNLCNPAVTVITNVSRDHTQILGSTVRLIAREKAGIIKSGVPVITGVSHLDAIDVVRETAERNHAPVWWLPHDVELLRRETTTTGTFVDIRTPESTHAGLSVPLVGEHQATNAALAVAAIDLLRRQGWNISEEALREGLAKVSWPARVEVVSRQPTVVIDAAHNWESAKALVRAVESEFPARRRILLFAATKDKDVAGVLRLVIPAFDTVIFTQYVDNPRGVPPGELRSLLAAMSDRPAHLAGDPPTAWKLARRLAEPEDLIVVTGSFFLVAELRDLILEECRQTQPSAGPGKIEPVEEPRQSDEVETV